MFVNQELIEQANHGEKKLSSDQTVFSRMHNLSLGGISWPLQPEVTANVYIDRMSRELIHAKKNLK